MRLKYLLLFLLPLTIYAVDITPTLLSIEDNPNIPPSFIIINPSQTSSEEYNISFNIINPISSSTEQFQTTINILSRTISVENGVRTVTISVSNTNPVYCTIVGYDPVSNLYNISYDINITINGQRTRSAFILSSGTSTIEFQDTMAMPHLLLVCFPPSEYIMANPFIVGRSSVSSVPSLSFQYHYRYSYLYSLPIYIATITNYTGYITIPILLNTQQLISEGKMKSDCSDIAITYYDPVTDTEKQVPFYLDPATCNSKNTIIYVKLPYLTMSNDIHLNLYFGNPDAIPMSSPDAFMWFVDFSSPSFLSLITIFNNGATYRITNEGLEISIPENAALVIYNK